MSMLSNISLGIYYPGNSLLHRLQARTKLLVLLWLMGFLIVADQRRGHFAPYVITVLLLALAVALSGISPGHLWRRMRLLVVVAAIGAIPILLFLTGKTLLTLGPVAVAYGPARWAMRAYGIAVAGFLLWLWLPFPGVRRRGHRYRWARRLAVLLALTLAVGLALLWLTRSERASATFPLGPLVITDEGVWVVVSATMILLVFYALGLLLTMTTTPVALIEGMTRLLAPLRRVGAPVDDFALMTLIALRFIPTLIDEAEQLVKAQTSRGADVTSGTIRERAQSLATWFVPLVQGTLRRAAELATALEARGYEVQGRQTALHEGALQTADYAVGGVVLLVTLGSLAL